MKSITEYFNYMINLHILMYVYIYNRCIISKVYFNSLKSK